MKSQNSLFNKGIIINNISRFWPLSVLIFVISFFHQALQIWDCATHTNGLENVKEALIDLMYSTQFMLVFYGFAAAYLSFRYLFHPQLCSQIHSFPLKRKTLFFSNVLSGFTLLLAPQVVNWLIILPAIFISGFKILAFDYLLTIITFNMFYFGTAVICAMITGNLVSMSIIYALIYAFRTLLYIFADNMNDIFYSKAGFVRLNENVSGIIEYVNPLRISLVCSGDYKAITEGSIIYDLRIYLYILFAAVGIGLLALSYFIYKKRRLEKAGSFITVRFLKPVLQWFTALAATVGATSLLLFADTISGFTFLIVFVFSGIVVSAAVAMIFEKTVKIDFKKELIKWAATAVCTFIIFAGANAYVNKYVPDSSKVEKVYLSAYCDTEYNLNEVYYLTKTDVKDEIDNIIKVHSSEVKMDPVLYFKEIDETETDYYRNPYYRFNYGETVPYGFYKLEYKLKNGALYYKYIKQSEESKKVIEPQLKKSIENNLSAYLAVNDIKNTDFEKIIRLSSYSGKNEFTFYFNEKDIKKIINSYMQDMAEHDIYEGSYYYFAVIPKNNLDETDPNKDLYDSYFNDYETSEPIFNNFKLRFNASYTRTINAIEEAAKNSNTNFDIKYLDKQ